MESLRKCSFLEEIQKTPKIHAHIFAPISITSIEGQTCAALTWAIGARLTSRPVKPLQDVIHCPTITYMPLSDGTCLPGRYGMPGMCGPLRKEPAPGRARIPRVSPEDGLGRCSSGGGLGWGWESGPLVCLCSSGSGCAAKVTTVADCPG